MRTAERLGFEPILTKLDENVELEDVLKTIDKICDQKGYGLIVQLPLTEGLMPYKDIIINAIPPRLDIDGLGVFNQGLMSIYSNKVPEAADIFLDFIQCPFLVPATVQSIIDIIREHSSNSELVGKKILIISQSNLIGKPLASMAMVYRMCPTIINSTVHVEDLEDEYDYIVSATGKPGIFKNWYYEDNLSLNGLILDCTLGKVNDKIVGDFGEIHPRKEDTIISGVGKIGVLTQLCLLENVLKVVELKGKIIENLQVIDREE